MLNLLIAVMGDSFERVKEREDSAARHEQARVISAREKFLVGWGLWKKFDRWHFPRCANYFLRANFLGNANALSVVVAT
jgi:hypothetical protein